MPQTVDAAALTAAPYLDAAPVPFASLAVGMSLFGDHSFITPDKVFVYSPSHGWRQVRMSATGLVRQGYREPQYRLSPDGTRLALGDRSGIVVMQLATGRGRRYRVPVREPLLFPWTRDSTSLIYNSRHAPSDRSSGRKLVLQSGTSRRTPYDPWVTSRGQSGGTMELLHRDGPRRAYRLLHRGGESSVKLAEAVRIHEPPAWQKQAAFVQHSEQLGGHRVLRGVVEFDPQTGNFTALLPLGSARWPTLLGWITPRALLFAVTGEPKGAIASWNPTRRRLAVHTRLPARGLNPDVAIERIARQCP